jgi:hypothetical protein
LLVFAHTCCTTRCTTLIADTKFAVLIYIDDREKMLAPKLGSLGNPVQ